LIVQTISADGALYPWAADFSLSDYAGPIFVDGVSEMINIINTAASTITVLAIAPCPNIELALVILPNSLQINQFSN
jgi:hypothetical protein